MAELTRLGAPVLGDAPVLTANLKAFFLHPSCFGGILVEFVENLHPWLDGVRYRPTEGAVGIDARRIAGITATVANVDAVAGEFARTIGAGAPHDVPCAWVDGAARTFPIGDIDITLVEAGAGARTGLRYVSVEVDDVEGAASTLETLGADVRRRAADDTSARTALVSWRGLHGVPMALVPAAG